MSPFVEPLEGPELDRLITALLNVTGSVFQVIEREGGQVGIPSDDGLAIIDRSATRLRSVLSVFAEHHGDEEIAPITEFLALTTMLIAEEGGFDDVFYAS